MTEDHATRSRIAVVAASLDIVGGQAVEAQILAEALRGDGYTVDFVPVNPAFPPGFRWLRRLPYARTALNEILYLPSLRALWRADVVHVFSASYWSFLLGPAPAMLVGRALGKRVLLNYHGGEAEDHLSRWGRLLRPWLSLAHEIVVPSEHLEAVFARHGYPVRVIHNVVDTRRFRYRDRRPLRPRLISTRNLEPHYRVDDTLVAFAHVRARYPEATLTIAGAGAEEGRLRTLAGPLGARRIRFLGRVDPAAMPALYDADDIFVNASVVDNQPVSVLEAFAAGLPVVTTPTGGIAQLVRDGETGVVVPPDDPQAIARAVTALLDDPARAERIARRARAEADGYTWPQVRDAWAAAYLGEAA